MKLLVNATSFDSRGGLTVVDSFLKELNKSKDFLIENNISIVVLVSHQELCSYKIENIDIIFNRTPKNGLISKWLFEKKYLPKEIKLKKIDVYLSLQNIGLGNIGIPQYVLIHQALTITDINAREMGLKLYLKYKLLMSWYFNMNKKFIKGIFVQTNWMKKKIVDQYNVDEQIIYVIKPTTKDISKNTKELTDKVNKLIKVDTIKLLYVTSEYKYKNTKRLIEAVNEYNINTSNKVSLFLTIDGTSTQYIKYIGKIPYNSMFTLYKNVDGLIFPSLAESLGLPILEAKQAGITVMASNSPYTTELSDNIDFYFDPLNVEDIINVLNKFANYEREIETISRPLIIKNDDYINYIKIIASNYRNLKT